MIFDSITSDSLLQHFYFPEIYTSTNALTIWNWCSALSYVQLKMLRSFSYSVGFRLATFEG